MAASKENQRRFLERQIQYHQMFRPVFNFLKENGTLDSSNKKLEHNFQVVVKIKI